jgi:serine phosphatase RsbU (regulator of sigma subunit)
LFGNFSEQHEYLQSIVDTVRDPLLVLNSELRVVSANRAFHETFRTSPKSIENSLIFELGSHQWDIPALRVLLEEVLPGNTVFNDFEVSHEFPQLGQRTMILNARKLYRPGNHTEMILLAMEDVTVQRATERAVREAYESLQVSHANLNTAYAREHRIAQALQQPLSLEIAEDAFPGVSIATLYEAASAEAEVGGDFFDVFTVNDGYLACVIGDASGKGLSAAARAVQVKEVLRAFAREYPHSPAHIVARLNDYVCGNQSVPDDITELFIALVMVIMNPRTGECTALSAGAEPPYILRADGETEVITVSGMPLGIESRIIYTTATFHLKPGDVLILLTDGITESRNKRTANDLFGRERLFEVARRYQNEPTLRETGKAVLEAARAFGGGVLRDDACLLLIRRK